MAKILIAGCGALGMQLGHKLAGQGHQVTGLKRNPPASGSGNFNFHRADIASGIGLENLDAGFDCLFFIVAPDQRTEENYRAVYETGLNNLLNRFGASNQPSWFLISSTSVYAQTQGEWVDEDSPAEPEDVCSRQIRQAELRLMNLNAGHTIVRFSGIYGPGRESLLRRAKQSPVIQQSPPYYSNRIHQQDCIGVLTFLLEQRMAGVTLENCYLASDDDPAPLWDVMLWLSRQMHCQPPVAKIIKTDCPMNKRCGNRRLKQLGYRFQYPSYQNGYLELIR